TRCRLIDVDLTNLNRVNEEFGQMVGDAVLRNLAELLRNAVPAPNLLGRLAGDEFLVIMPRTTTAEAESLADTIRRSIAEHKLDLGGKGVVSSVKANVSVATYMPEEASLHETVILAKGVGGLGVSAEAEGMESEGYHHVPRVTLGAFAVRRWQRMSEAEQKGFALWKQDLDQPTTDSMATEILKVLDEKAEDSWVDFVTAVPAHDATGTGRTYPARQLAEAVASKIGVSYRQVMRAESAGPDARAVEPVVDATITKGSGVLLISDLITSGTLERQCVKRLFAAGARVQMVAWAAH
ncbi:MAG: diguanylate cyclase, partial [Candidatus Brocadiae bacterium]|nr:diguanylate cyclase [Candidatus Brocadiia bacterium]